MFEWILGFEQQNLSRLVTIEIVFVACNYLQRPVTRVMSFQTVTPYMILYCLIRPFEILLD